MAAALTGLGMVLFFQNRREQSLDPVTPVMALAFPALGAFIVSKHPRNLFGWTLCATSLLGLDFFVEQYASYSLVTEPGSLPGGVWMAWVGTWVWAPGLLGVRTLALLFFPYGHLPRGSGRHLSLAVLVLLAATMVLAALAPGPMANYPADNPIGISSLPRLSELMAATFVFILAPACLGDLLVRFRRSAGTERTQLKPFAIAATIATLAPLMGVLVAYGPLPLGSYQAIGLVTLLAMPAAVLFTMKKHGLYEVGPYEITAAIERSFVYTGLIAILLVGCWATVNLAGAPLPVGLAVVALAFRPLRRLLELGVAWARRASRASAAMQDLGHILESNLPPDEVLPAIVNTIVSVLRVPYVAVEVGHRDGVAASEVRGEVRADAEVFPLVHREEVVGRLAVASGREGEPLPAVDRGLLEDLAHHLGVAAYSVRVTADLQRAKERLVTAREKERRKWKDLLHDRINPALGGVLTQLNPKGFAPEGVVSEVLLKQVRADLKETMADVKRLELELRPRSLDELGLVGALRQHLARFGLPPSPLVVTVDAPATLEGLPTDVEVAAFLIVCEAVENVRKHAEAGRCEVLLNVADGWLQVQVCDDGTGLADSHRSGIGISAMTKRAVELHGDFGIESRPQGGTRVTARLPLAL